MAPVEGPHGRGPHRRPGHGAAHGSARDQRTSRPAAKEGVLRDFLADKRRVEVLVVGLAFFLYWSTVRAGFVYDDSRAVLRNPDVLGTSPWSALLFNDFWGTPMSHSGSHGSYRPVAVLSLRLDALLARHVLGRGLSPVGFHLVNMALHAVASLLVLRLGRRLLGRWAAAVAGVLFAAHPVHCEAVAGLVGRADLLCAVFFLRAVHDYVRYVDWRETHRCTHSARKLAESPAYVASTDLVNKMLDRVLHEPRPKGGRPGRRRAADSCAACGVRTAVLLGSSVGLTVLATLSKEVGITALGVCFVYELLVQQRRRQRNMPVVASGLVLLAGVSAALLLARLWVMGLRVPHFAAADNPAAKDPSLLTRTLTFLHLPVVNLGLLLWPQRLCFDWSMEAVPRVASAADPRNALSVALYLCLWRLCRRTYRRLLRPGAGEDAEDAGVAPKRTEGVAVGLALLVLPALPATNLFFYVGFVVAERVLYVPSVGFCFLVALGARRLRARRDVVEAVLAVAVLALAARTVARNADWLDEEALYRSGIDVNPPKAYGNLGSVLSAANRLAEAEQAYRMALRHRPNMAEVHYNLGNLLAVMNKYDESARSYEQAIHYRPTLALAYVNLGHILARQGRVQDATEVFRKCVLIPSAGLRDPAGHEAARVSALMHLAHIQVGQGRLAQAQRDLDLALRISPAHYETGPILKLMAEVTSGLKANQTTAGKAVKVVLKKRDTALTSSPGTLLNESRCVTSESRSRVLSHS